MPEETTIKEEEENQKKIRIVYDNKMRMPIPKTTSQCVITPPGTKNEPDLDSILKYFISKQINKELTKASDKEKEKVGETMFVQAKKLTEDEQLAIISRLTGGPRVKNGMYCSRGHTYMTTTDDSSHNAPSENPRSDNAPSENPRSDNANKRIVHHYNIKGLKGYYLEEPGVNNYTQADFVETMRQIEYYAETEYLPAVARSFKKERNQSAVCYKPPATPFAMKGGQISIQEQEVYKIRLKTYCQKLDKFDEDIVKLVSDIRKISSKGFVESMRADNRYEAATDSGNL